MAERSTARRCTSGNRGRRGQATIEFAILYGTVMVPVLFGIVYLAQLLWVWHSVVEFTREGARYAATHCWEEDGQNVIDYMHANVPPNIDIAEFRAGGRAQISVQYFERDSASGQLAAFACAPGCSAACEPDAVTVTVTSYQFQHYVTLLKSVTIPPFSASQATDGNGCDQTGTCNP
jgi:Flp pilus assembly protein TadG